MESITIGQLARGAGIITALWVFREKIIKGFNKTFDDKLSPIKKDLEMLNSVTYVLLEHRSTNNNTGEMKAALDKYVEYKIKS